MMASPASPDAIEPQQLRWARRLQALAQTGLTFAQDPYDIERYQELREISLEMLSAVDDQDPGQIVRLFESERGYATPKVDVRGAVIREGKILLVRETSDGRWALPGGWADVNASPRENVEKEILEESGYQAKVIKLAAVYDRLKHPHEPAHPFHIYKLFFLCALTGGTASGSIETSEVGFFAEDELPELSRGRVLESQIKRMFQHHRNPDLATDFD